MKPVLTSYLTCPECSGSLRCAPLVQEPFALDPAERALIIGRGLDPAGYETEILSGRLDCAGCGTAFPVSEGVPRLYKDAEKDWPLPTKEEISTAGLGRFSDDRNVQATFSREWDEFDYGDNTIWHWTIEERIATFCEEVDLRSPEELRGKLMVDAGCGPALLSMNLSARHGVEVICMDLSFVLSRAFRQSRSALCHFIQCSVLAPPLRPAIADLTYSHGVLHHTQSTAAAFAAIERLTKPGGVLYVWLYGRKRGWNRIKYGVIRAIRAVNSRLPKYPQTAVIWLLTGMHLLIRLGKQLVGMPVAPITSLNQMLVVTRDRYTPKHAREHTEAEVTSWFTRKGYQGVTRRTEWQTVPVWNGSTDLAIRGRRPR
jgi:SAM-dependent methyltransferase/uncharacterized protein YbaR (Trm112 family)